MATYMPCERLTGSNDLLVMINPSNNNRFIPLTQERISLWARAIVVNKEVTFANPPNSLPFDFITADEYHSKYQGGRSSSPQRSTSQNHIGAGSPQTPQGTAGDQAINNSTPFANLNELFANHPNLLPVLHFNAMHLGGNASESHGCSSVPAFPPGAQTHGFPISTYSNNPAPPSSPAPSDGNLDLDDYLRYCHVNIGCQIVKDAFDTLGISHYTDFENFEVAELQEAGLKLANARALKMNMKKYARHLRSIRRRTK
ncbi:hypothetical protein MJO29_006752 [Puccinia striiformis f. sp. tritici]|nr:hypothetical protein MJO29_006752 [Puccinia striiformis f. sp. tritici]